MDNGHISEKKIENYILKYLINDTFEKEAEADDFEIEQHISECDVCAEKINKLYKQYKMLSEWNVYTDNQLVMRNRVLGALEKRAGIEENNAVKERLLTWMNGFKGFSSGAVKFLMNAHMCGTRKVSRFITEGLEFFNIKDAFSFDYELNAIPSRGGSSEAQVNMKEIKATTEERTIKVKLNSRESELRIELEGEQSIEPPIAMLLSFERAVEPVFGKPEWNEEKNCWQISIKDISEGEYSLLFEPKKW
jgi:hypothetical protein